MGKTVENTIRGLRYQVEVEQAAKMTVSKADLEMLIDAHDNERRARIAAQERAETLAGEVDRLRLGGTADAVD
jgi:hypothetical protein